MSIIQEFYVNAKIEMNGFSSVRGVIVDYRPAAIRNVLGLTAPEDGVEDWG